jgi:L-seryl-tRNA(Ser) seleniumtransferase
LSAENLRYYEDMTAPDSPPGPPGAELRKLPKADRLLDAAERAGLVARLGHGAVMEAVRGEIERARREVLAGGPCPAAAVIERALLARLAVAQKGSLRAVVNATGVIVHTNLGRAPLSAETQEAMRLAAAGYTNLEYDLEAGERGDRYGHAEAPLCRLTGAEAAVVVNNNASAVMLALAALMGSRPSGDAPVEGTPEVVVSRGQLVEIGGGFRIPDVLRRSGAALAEVGTTNRTYRRDFEDALTPRTRLLMSVHRSNFKVEGFVHDTSLEELVSLGREQDLWVVDDLGSGTLLETAPFGLGVEPTVQDRIRAGADVVCFSGDKLLGGPQAGILAGKAEAIRRVKRHPLMRALRVDKVTLAGVSATLAHYERGEATTAVPIWRAIATPPEALAARAAEWLRALGPAGEGCEVRGSASAVGGGSLPEVTLPTFVLALPAGAPDDLLARLRTCNPPIIARIEEDRVVLDPRTVMPGEDGAVVRGLAQTLGAGRPA